MALVACYCSSARHDIIGRQCRCRCRCRELYTLSYYPCRCRCRCRKSIHDPIIRYRCRRRSIHRHHILPLHEQSMHFNQDPKLEDHAIHRTRGHCTTLPIQQHIVMCKKLTPPPLFLFLSRPRVCKAKPNTPSQASSHTQVPIPKLLSNIKKRNKQTRSYPCHLMLNAYNAHSHPARLKQMFSFDNK